MSMVYAFFTLSEDICFFEKFLKKHFGGDRYVKVQITIFGMTNNYYQTFSSYTEAT